VRVKSRPVSIKAAGTNEGTDDGVFEAIVATYDVDDVGDKIVPGAFAETLERWKASGSPIPVLWSHMSMDPEYHIGVVEDAEERDEGLWVRARIDLDDDSPKAKKVYRLLKGRRVTQFSFAYDIEQGGYVEEKNDDGDDEAAYFELRKLRLYEVGPTLVGANQNTDLLDVKSASGRDIRVSIDTADRADQLIIRRAVEKAFDMPHRKSAISPHSTATDDAAWDGPANEKNLPDDAGQATLKAAFAWADPDGDPEAKASYKFIHHFVGSDGKVGAASTKACTTGIAVLNGGRTGTTIPDADRQGVYDHLRMHLVDSGVDEDDIPELAKSGDRGTDEPKAADTDVSAALGRVESAVAELRELLGSSDEDGEPPSDDEKAAPAQPAAPVKGSPAAPGPASLRLRTDLAALAAEVTTLTG